MSRTRWHLSRGGVINIWEYGRETFDFSGGRVIFQGTNGSGKSRTLELLAPLCLDGDLRQMGSKGYDTVSMRRLMLDDYSGDSTRIGYAWLELTRTDSAGTPEFLTCGIGVKASKNSGQINDSWRFITPRRVEHDVELAPEDMPLGPTQLRDAIGADCILDDEEFRARIAENVYVIPAARYGDLLHLQRTLRNPDIGVKVFDGHLESILSDALPPLEQSIVEQLAASFEDLHSIQDNVRQLQSADTALARFLETYRGYVTGALHRIGARWQSAAQAHNRGRRDLEALTRQIAELTEAETEAAGRVAAAEERGAELDQLVADLKALPAFAELTDLGHQQRLVDTAHDGARSALADSARARAAQDRAADAVQAALDRLQDEVASAADRGVGVRTAFERAGLDTALVPDLQLPRLDVPTATVAVRTDLADEPEPATVRLPPEWDLDVVHTSVEAAGAALDTAIAAAREQGALTRTLHQRAVALDRSAVSVEAMARAADGATREAAEAEQAVQRAHADLDTAVADWHAAAEKWHAAVSPQAPRIPEPAVLAEDAAAPRAARAEVDRWAAALRQELHGALHAGTEEVATCERELAEVRAELTRLRAGHEPEPPRPAYSTAERDPGSGAPFFRLVDFAPDLAPEQAAGLEAALTACGLLTAWVSADGGVTDDDVVAVPGGPPAEGRSLADVLVPAREPDCPVTEATIRGLLGSVALEDGKALAVRVNGQWRAGVLHGAWRKDAAEYIGAGARAAAVARAIGEQEARESTLRDVASQAVRRREAASAAIEESEERLAGFPDHTDLVAAHTRAVDAAGRVQRLSDKAIALREEHESASERIAAEREALHREAAGTGLSGDTEVLAGAADAARTAAGQAGELRTAVQRGCARGVADLAARRADHAVADRDRVAVSVEAERRIADYRVAATALAEMTESVGENAADLGSRLRDLETEQRALRRSMPELRQAEGAAARARITAEAQQEAKAEGMAAAREAESAAAAAFAAARRAPGAWSAAVGGPLPEEHAAALRQLSAGAGSEDDVLSGLQALQAQLAAGYTVAPERHDDIVTVTVSGVDGRLPVADAAARVSARLQECSEQLGDRYQDIFSEYLINDLSVSLATQIGVAEDLYQRMNAVLDNARSSQGVHVQLQWSPSSALDEPMLQAMRIIRTPVAGRSAADEQTLRKVFTERIEAERDDAADSYVGILSRALDYRAWFDFSVIVRDFDGDGKPRTRRFRNLSSGETRLISYVTLFAAAAAFYDALSSAAGPGAEPLRLTLLDEAFERIDDPTIARMLGLLVDLDMDWIITWPSGWGISPKIPRMHIYDVLRPEKGRGIACAHTTWDGSGLTES